MFNPALREPFEMFSVTHFIVLAVSLLLIALLLLSRKFLKNPKHQKIFRLTLGISLVVMEATYKIWVITESGFVFKDVIPLGLCALTARLTMIALIFNLDKLSRLILPWAFVGAVLSLIVVEVDFAFPHFRFFHYFYVHLGFLIGNLYFLITSDNKLKYKDILNSTYVLSIVSVFILIFNFIFISNHMFLNRLPDAFDFLNDLLPWYVNTLGLVAIIFLLFNLFYGIYLIFGHFNKNRQKNYEIF